MASTHLNNSPTYLNRREVEGSSAARSKFSALSRARVAPSFANYREWKHTRVTPSNCVTRTDERNRAMDNRARAVVTQRSNRVPVRPLSLPPSPPLYMCVRKRGKNTRPGNNRGNHARRMRQRRVYKYITVCRTSRMIGHERYDPLVREEPNEEVGNQVDFSGRQIYPAIDKCAFSIKKEKTLQLRKIRNDNWIF